MKRLFNIGHGLAREADSIPERILSEARESGAAKGQIPDLQRQLEEYYLHRERNSNGTPSNDHLVDLGLGDFVSWNLK